MLKLLVELHLKYRYYVVLGAIILSLYGVWCASRLPIDVFPDINRPYVTIMVDAHGYAPEEVERLIVFPIETSLNGAPGVESVRSSSGVGLGTVTVNFEWGQDIYLCRQIVQERLQLAREDLPPGVEPMLAPVSAITGEIMRVGLTSDGTVSPIELRSIADWDLRLKLMTVPGVAQIVSIGGGVKQYELRVNQDRMAQFGVTLHDVEQALVGVNMNMPGGFVYSQGRELIVRNIGRFGDLSDLESLVVENEGGRFVRLKDVATLLEGRVIPRGSAGVNTQESVILTVLKQPGANTLELTERLQGELEKLQDALPAGVTIHQDIYLQSDFIEAAVDNVIEALRDGSILVVVVIVLFLMNFRMSIIILAAIPLSFISTALVFAWFGMTVNTMTLGGLAVAVGELVDSAIVGAENIYRRLRENRAKPLGERRSFYLMIADATHEVMSSIVLGTAIVLLVVVPLFGLPGIVGRLFAPIGIAYLISIAASMVVAITVTPVLCSLLLRNKLPDFGKDTFLVRWLKKAIEPVVLFSVRFSKLVLALGAAATLWALLTVSQMGADLLPDFNEGAAYVVAMAPAGVNLEESTKIGRAVEAAMKEVPEVAAVKTGRRTGRAEGDEHVMGVNISEIEAVISTEDHEVDRSREEILEDLRYHLDQVPGVLTEVQQPLQHRISHIISGARTQVVIKIFGPELDELRRLAENVHDAIKTVQGVVDDSVEQQALVPQIRIEPKPAELARYGLPLNNVLETMEIALQGKVLSQVQEGERYFDFVLRGEQSLRENPDSIGDFLIRTPDGRKVPLKAVADVEQSFGPNQISHENARRRIFVTCNVADRDLGGAVADIEAAVAEKVEFPPGYTYTLGGQYEELVSSGRAMTFLSAIALLLIIALLVGTFRSLSLATIVLLNIPQALLGSVVALILTGTNLNMGAVVGFVALCGIASRNGILMISHYVTLLKEEGEEMGPHLFLRGCQERLTPVLMTALTTNLGLIPLVLAEGQPGKEILYPVALVIFGGLITSTVLDFTITPAAASLYGRRGIERLAHEAEEGIDEVLEEEGRRVGGPAGAAV